MTGPGYRSNMGDDAEHHRMIIAGSGIAGLSAAIYAGRSNNEPLVLEGTEPGGQLTLTTDVANYPGFPEGISGPELINDMRAQAERFGAEIDHGVVVDVTVEGEGADRRFRVELRDGTVYTTDALIAASGASARTLDVPGEDELMGYGVSTCATCDGAFFRGEDMLVVGGGDAAMEEANFLTKFADTVYVAHRREEFRAEDYWVDRTMEKVEAGEIELLRNTELLEIHGSVEEGVSHVTLATNESGHPKEKLDAPPRHQRGGLSLREARRPGDGDVRHGGGGGVPRDRPHAEHGVSGRDGRRDGRGGLRRDCRRARRRTDPDRSRRHLRRR